MKSFAETLSRQKRLEWSLLFAGCVVFALALVTYLLRVKTGLTALEFVDETEKFVSAHLITRGWHLYKDFFEHHGAMPFMMAHLYAAAVGGMDFSYVRLTQAALAIASCVAVAWSPVIKTVTARMWAAALYLVLLSSVWTQELLHMLLYQAIGGFLFVVLLSQCVIPFFFGVKPTRNGLWAAGAASGFACFAAYHYVLPIFLFLLACWMLSNRKRDEIWGYAKPFFFSALAATAVVCAWLWAFADLRGYYVYHIYFNHEILWKFIAYSPSLVFNTFAISFEPRNIVHTMAILLLCGWLCVIVGFRGENIPKRTWGVKILAGILIVSGVAFLDPRGHTNNFHHAGFLITNFALFSITTTVLLQRSIASGSLRATAGTAGVWIGAWLGVQLAAQYAVANSPWQRNEAQLKVEIKPEKSPIYDFVRSITKKEGDLLVLPFDPLVYIKADRIPASGHFYYLPWQADYNRHAKPGYLIDICSDLKQRNPAVIWLFNWRVWGRYSMETYEPCVLSFIAEGYAPLDFNSPWYIRKDILAKHSGPLPSGTEYKSPFLTILERSAQLDESAPIPIHTSPEHEARSRELKRIGVLFTTNGAQRTGEAELHLSGRDGTEFSARFSLSSIVDNEFRFFDLAPKQYMAGEIRAISGGGISTWESHWEKNLARYWTKNNHFAFAPHPKVETCVTYEYIDGSRSYTPTCPLMNPPRHSETVTSGHQETAGTKLSVELDHSAGQSSVHHSVRTGPHSHGVDSRWHIGRGIHPARMQDRADSGRSRA